MTCHVASGDLTTFENLIISIGQESKPVVFLEVLSGIANYPKRSQLLTLP